MGRHRSGRAGVRAVAGEVSPDDISCGADQLARGLRSAATDGRVDTGFPMDSAWRVSCRRRTASPTSTTCPPRCWWTWPTGADLAREQARARAARLAAGPGRSAGQRGDVEAGVPMRCVFALTAMGFVPDPSADEIVRIRVLPAWLRIDARFGSVFRRRAIRRWCCVEEQRRTPVILEGPAARLAVGLPAGIALGAPLWHFGVVVALLGGWTALALIFTSWTWILLWPFKADDTKKHASDEEGRLWVVAGLILVGAVASLVGCGTCSSPIASGTG